MTNALLISMICLILLKNKNVGFSNQANASATLPEDVPSSSANPAQFLRFSPEDLNPLQNNLRHQLTYEEWVELLSQEAAVVAEQNPSNLKILLGDSLTLWFPAHLLSPDATWLNQGISGETITGLLERLDLLDRTRPTTIYIMLGVNDLLKGDRDSSILADYTEIIRSLKASHPQAKIVVQSILPHASENNMTWEGRDRLLEIPNTRIQELNQGLQAIALEEGIHYLDLYSLVVDPNGDLQPSLTTDGLHLNTDGYLVWRTALEMLNRE
jgi:lysophospholipase L1-like esterase